ncbi:MAG: hypothetical protein COB09_18930 [Thalassobium sp.]|nr:MAG: hypothetical protein COB09_18930 [Thalassobium sp.]
MTTEKDIEDCAARALRFENLAGELLVALEYSKYLSEKSDAHIDEWGNLNLLRDSAIKKAEDMKNDNN